MSSTQVTNQSLINLFYFYLPQTCHIGWLCIAGNLGEDTGSQSYVLIIRSASKKFLSRLATNKSCRNNVWKVSLIIKIIISLYFSYYKLSW